MTRDRQRIEEAATWVGRLDQPAVDTSVGAAFDRWMEADPRHREEFVDTEALWQSELLAQALREAKAMPDPKAASVRNVALPWRRRGGTALAACAAFIAVGLAVPVVLTTTYRAGHGAGRSVSLADGSRVDLSGEAELRVRILPWRRDATLTRGEAFFDVHHEADRPFVVHSGATDVRVLGTAFDVDFQGPGRTIIQVYRGAVALESGKADNIIIRRGESARVVNDRLAAQPVAFNIAQHRQPDWRSGWFEATDAPMGVLIDKVRRYSSREIRFADPTLADRPVSGRFRVADPDRVLQAIQTAYGAEVHVNDDAIVISINRASRN